MLAWIHTCIHTSVHMHAYIHIQQYTYIQGRRPRGTGGTVPPKFEVGDRPCIGPPNILRSIVLSDVRESMNRVKNCVFLVRKWSYTTFNIVNIRKMWEKKGKIRRTRSMTKKKLIRNFYPENGNFS